MDLTRAERSALLTSLNSASIKCSHFIKFLDSQPLNELTNSWYRNTCDLQMEMWDAWDFVYQMVYGNDS